jgi:Fic family protein
MWYNAKGGFFVGYIPPFSITEEMLGTVSDIMEALGQISGVNDLDKLPRLRRAGRIRSVHSSLAIENNTLTLDQVSAILDGKRVLGPPDEIREVKNAFAAYKELENINPYDIKDLLKIHNLMTENLIEESGKFRTGAVGVFEKEKVIHVAPQAERIPELMTELFEWLKSTKAHPLIKSSVFHYEFEFIHPFRDGNGRMGRLWQTAILSEWKPIFAWIPIESIIHGRQTEYYRAIAASTSNGASNPFVLYMLQIIREAVKNIVADARSHINHISDKISALLAVLTEYPLSAAELMKKLNLKSRESFRDNYLRPAIEAGLVGLTEPDKSTSKNQRYFKK